MPPKAASGKVGGLAAALGAKAKGAFDSHKGDATKYGNMNLPGGIDPGVAQLVECKFDFYKEGDLKGKPFFHAAGVVKSPKVHNGVPVAGLRTTITEPLCDTPKKTRKTTEEHIAWVLNLFRQLGVDTKGLEFEDFEPTAAQLKEASPFFSFRTSSIPPSTPGQSPFIYHEWNKRLDNFDESETPTGAEDDATGGGGNEGGETTAAAGEGGDIDVVALAELADAQDADAARQLEEYALAQGIEAEALAAAANWAEVAELLTAQAGDSGSGEGGDEDWAALGEAADGGDSDAAEKMNAEARERGIDPDTIPTFVELAALLSEGGDESPDEPPAPKKIEKGSVWKYKVDPKKAKLSDVEVTEVQAKQKTVTVKNLDNNKIIKGVPFDKLMS